MCIRDRTRPAPESELVFTCLNKNVLLLGKDEFAQLGAGKMCIRDRRSPFLPGILWLFRHRLCSRRGYRFGRFWLQMCIRDRCRTVRNGAQNPQ